MSRKVKQELTGGRDELILSTWHRSLGWDYPACDIDLLMIEYNYGKPYALVEYKRMNGKRIPRNHPTLRAISALADGSKIPAMVVRYSPECDMFSVAPLNNHARAFVPTTTIMSEEQYKNLLATMKKRFLEKAENDNNWSSSSYDNTSDEHNRINNGARDPADFSDLAVPPRNNSERLVN